MNKAVDKYNNTKKRKRNTSGKGSRNTLKKNNTSGKGSRNTLKKSNTAGKRKSSIKDSRKAARKQSSRSRSMNSGKRNGRSSGMLEYIWIVGCLVLLVIGVFIWNRSGSDDKEPSRALVSSEVSEYRPLIKKYASKYGISEYVDIIEAMMQQESAGAGSDVMQSSECIYNEEYEHVPGGIQDPEYSIDAGVHYFADCLEMAGCTGIDDTDALKLALQGYNFGSNYITWTIEKGESYTAEGAISFSEMMKEELGWGGYGDPDYPQHVLRYYRYE